MSEPLQIPLPDTWRARVASVRASSTGLRSLLQRYESLVRENDVARGLVFYWLRDGQPQKISGDRITGVEKVPQNLQEQSMEKAVVLSAKEGKVLRLPPGFVSGGLSLDDLVGRPWTEEDLPLFNATESTHLLLPLMEGGEGKACLHAWFREGEGRERLPELLKMVLDEIARFVGGQSTEAQSALIADYAVQLRLFESVCGEKDTEDFAIYVTNFVRRLTGSNRVTLFGARSRNDTITVGEAKRRRGGSRLRLLGASGLDTVSERSAEAVFLGEVASAMVEALLRKQEEGEGGLERRGEHRAILVLAPRDPGKDSLESRSEALHAYFENEPADWLCALALRGEEGEINGYVLCEGQGNLPAMDRVREIFSRLDRPIGRTWARLLAWGSLRARLASRFLRLESGQSLWRRRAIWMIPLLIIGLFFLPVPFDVTGDATVSSRAFRTLSAPFRANLEEVTVSRGEAVKTGDVLGRLQVEEEVLRRAELASRLAALEMQARLAQQEGKEQEAALARINGEVFRAELALVGSRLERAVFQAPFDGIVVGPENFSEREGTLLQEGDSVFELARADAFSLTLLLREQDFEVLREFAAEGRVVAGVFRPSSDPSRELSFEIESLEDLPVFVEDKRPGSFRVAVRLPVNWPADKIGGEALSETTGRVELALGKRSLFFVTFRDFAHYLRLNLFL